MKELPLHSHRGLRGSASHPRPTDEVRLEPISHHAVREREVSKRTPFITLGRSTRGGCREATTRGKILDLHHRHSVEGSTEVQGNAPLLSVTHREKETPESSYPLSHIRQDERAGRDSQEAFAQRASKKRGGRFPATTTAALLDRSLPPIREDRIPGPIPRTRHQDAGRRIHHLAPPQRQPQSCWSRSLLVSRSREGSGWETRPSPPVIQSWESRMFLPATTTAALLDRSLPPIREDQILGPTPRTRHQDAGRDDNRGATRRVPASNPRRSDSGSHPSHSSSRRGTAHPSPPGRKIPRNDNRKADRAGPFAPIPREISFRVPSYPSRRQAAQERSTIAHRIAQSAPGGSGPAASSRSTRFHMLSAGSNFPLSSL